MIASNLLQDPKGSSTQLSDLWVTLSSGGLHDVPDTCPYEIAKWS